MRSIRREIAGQGTPIARIRALAQTGLYSLGLRRGHRASPPRCGGQRESRPSGNDPFRGKTNFKTSMTAQCRDTLLPSMLVPMPGWCNVVNSGKDRQRTYGFAY